MRMPEMSVVRFEESDIICASAPVGTRIYLSQWANGDRLDGKIELQGPGGRVLFYNSQQDPVNDMSLYFGNGNYSFYDDPTHPVAYYMDTLINNDAHDPENPSNGADGYYSWDGNGGFGKVSQ